MKVGKDGKLKLSKGERQIGNFVFKNEQEHIKIMDISSSMSVRLSKTALNSGRLLDLQMKEKQNGFLHNYASLIYNITGLLVDEQFMVEANDLCIACVNRHKDFYGIEDDLPLSKDKEILDEAKEVYDAIEELKKEE